jgi:toxin ParE1/3/4
VTQVVWTSPARADLREIRNYIAPDSLRYARLTVQRIIAAVTRLRQFPLSGRIVPELERADIREVIQGNFRIVYRVKPGLIEILAVVHAARAFPSNIGQGK